MTGSTDWSKLHDYWYRDAKVKRLLREFGPSVGAYWAYLIGAAHAASHHTYNPAGIIRDTSRALIADDLNDRHDRVEMFKAMHNRKLIKVSGESWQTDPEASIDIEMIAFAKNQTPKGSRQSRRYANDAKSESLQGNVRTLVNSVRICPPDIDIDIDIDREEKQPTPSAHTGAPTHTHTREDAAVTQAVEAVATHLNEDAGIWHDRIGMWWSANQHTTSGDLVAALIAITVAPQKVKNPWQYFQRIVKRENGETRKIEKDVAVAAQKHDESVKPARGWRDWAERLAIIEAKERGEA